MALILATATQADLDALEARVRSESSRADAAETRLRSAWHDQASWYDAIPLVLFSTLALLGVACYIWWLKGAQVWDLDFPQWFSLVVGPLVGVFIVAVGMILGRLLNGFWAEWISGLTVILGTVIFVIMVYAIPGHIKTAPQNPTIEVNRGGGMWDEVQVKELKLPTTFGKVTIFVQAEEELTPVEAKAITKTEPRVISVPKGSHGKVYYSVDDKDPSLASSY